MLTVRRARGADAADAHLLIGEYCRDFAIVVGDDAQAMQTYLTGDGAMWIAYDDQLPVGCVALRPLLDLGPRAAEVKRLYVRPSHRRFGVAALLMDALEEHARDAGCEALYLDTKDDLIAAIAFYDRRGYARIERYNDNPQATIFMRLELGSLEDA